MERSRRVGSSLYISIVVSAWWNGVGAKLHEREPIAARMLPVSTIKAGSRWV